LFSSSSLIIYKSSVRATVIFECASVILTSAPSLKGALFGKSESLEGAIVNL